MSLSIRILKGILATKFVYRSLMKWYETKEILKETIFVDDDIINPVKRENKFKKNNVIAVRNHSLQPWRYDLFVSKRSVNSFECYHGTWKCARKLTPAEKGEN